MNPGQLLLDLFGQNFHLGRVLDLHRDAGVVVLLDVEEILHRPVGYVNAGIGGVGRVLVLFQNPDHFEVQIAVLLLLVEPDLVSRGDVHPEEVLSYVVADHSRLVVGIGQKPAPGHYVLEVVVLVGRDPDDAHRGVVAPEGEESPRRLEGIDGLDPHDVIDDLHVPLVELGGLLRGGCGPVAGTHAHPRSGPHDDEVHIEVAEPLVDAAVEALAHR